MYPPDESFCRMYLVRNNVACDASRNTILQQITNISSTTSNTVEVYGTTGSTGFKFTSTQSIISHMTQFLSNLPISIPSLITEQSSRLAEYRRLDPPSESKFLATEPLDLLGLPTQ
jgi:hypothetical protein